MSDPNQPGQDWGASSSGSQPGDTEPLGEPARSQPAPPPSPPYDGPSTPPPPPPAHPADPADDAATGDHPPSRRRGLLGPILAAVVASAVVSTAVTLALVGDAEEAQTQEPTGEQVADAPDDPPTGDPEDRPDPPERGEIADIADQVIGTVARVDVEAPGMPEGLQGPDQQPQGGTGSAVVYREDGYLITNAHVVGNADTTQVTLGDGTQAEAEIVGTFEPNDLAVLRVLDEDVALTAAPFADASPRVGESAIAVGSPFGLDATVTSGIISATGRTLEAPDGQVLPDMLQTDAAINVGNSGGALVDAAGNVVGINTAILGSGPQGGNIGIGFAVPAQIATSVADQLIEDGVVSYAQLGVIGNDLPPSGAEELGVPGGALVQDVEPGGAADGVVEPGDVIVGIDGETVEGFADLAAEVRVREPGDAVTLTLLRDGEEQEVETELGEAQDG